MMAIRFFLNESFLVLILMVVLLTDSAKSSASMESDAGVRINILCAVALRMMILDRVIVCYLSSWAVYRPLRGSFAIENFDPLLCTHVVYAFAGLDFETDSIKSLDEWQDLRDNYGKGGYDRIIALKNRYPHLKVSLAIGGWNEGSVNYSSMVMDAARRQRFVRNAFDFVRKYNFDGLDLDWEYPTQRGGRPADRTNFVALITDLRKIFRPHRLLLTSAIGAARNIITTAYDVRALSALLDYLHVMCYDYGGAWDGRVTANAPLYGKDELNVQATVELLIDLGASSSKIVLGVPFYGRSFVTRSSSDGKLLEGRLGDPTTDMGFQGPYTKENGFLGYNELCKILSDNRNNSGDGWQSEYNSTIAQNVARWFNASSNEWHVVTYDSMRSVAAKVRYAVRHRLAGVMVWSVDTDDFLGDCPVDPDAYIDFPQTVLARQSQRTIANFPMLRTLNEAFVLAADEMRLESENAVEADNEIPNDDLDAQVNAPQPNGTDDLTATDFRLNAVVLLVTLTSLLRK